ncbi:hypothetical protein B0I35DRAFT_431504, partial [Stachybotrys elegans]
MQTWMMGAMFCFFCLAASVASLLIWPLPTCLSCLPSLSVFCNIHRHVMYGTFDAKHLFSPAYSMPLSLHASLGSQTIPQAGSHAASPVI